MATAKPSTPEAPVTPTEAELFAAVKAQALEEGKAVMDLPNGVRVDN